MTTTKNLPAGTDSIVSRIRGTVTLANGSVRPAVRTARESGAVSIWFDKDPAKSRSRAGTIPSRQTSAADKTFTAS